MRHTRLGWTKQQEGDVVQWVLCGAFAGVICHQIVHPIDYLTGRTKRERAMRVRLDRYARGEDG